MQKKMNVILTLFLVFMVLCSCSKRVMTWQEQYDIGVRYLSEGNYEEAVIAFTAAIDIDPKKVESYIAMSEVYQQQGEDELAYEILERGYHETKSDRLHRVLNAELANKVLKSDATIRETLERLYQCLKEEDVSGIADAFEKWCNLIIESLESEIEDERNEVAYSDLLFDGERFYAKGEYSGVCLLFDGVMKLYYGEQTDGIPDGTGSLLVTNTIYHDGGVQCYIQKGIWSQGKSIGQAEIVDFASNSHTQTDFSGGWKIQCAYDDQEVMQTADVTQICVINSEEHKVNFHVAEGKLMEEEWYKNGIKCYVHNDCGMGIYVDDMNEIYFENPWGSKNKMPEDLNYFGLFAWGRVPT